LPSTVCLFYFGDPRFSPIGRPAFRSKLRVPPWMGADSSAHGFIDDFFSFFSPAFVLLSHVFRKRTSFSCRLVAHFPSSVDNGRTGRPEITAFYSVSTAFFFPLSVSRTITGFETFLFFAFFTSRWRFFDVKPSSIFPPLMAFLV